MKFIVSLRVILSKKGFHHQWEAKWQPQKFGVDRWCEGAGEISVLGRPSIWIILGQGTTVLSEDASGGHLDIYSLIYHFSFSFSLSLGDGPI